jgi:hypothetical protein
MSQVINRRQTMLKVWKKMGWLERNTMIVMSTIVEENPAILLFLLIDCFESKCFMSWVVTRR